MIIPRFAICRHTHHFLEINVNNQIFTRLASYQRSFTHICNPDRETSFFTHPATSFLFCFFIIYFRLDLPRAGCQYARLAKKRSPSIHLNFASIHRSVFTIHTKTRTHTSMKLQILVAACLAVAAFAAPMPQFVDPDCVEEDLAVEEPAQEIEADFALGLPDLIINFGSEEAECEDEAVEPTAAAAPQATEECEDPITTEEVVHMAAPTEAECVDEPIEVTTEEATPEPSTAAECEEEFETTPEPIEAPADECAEDVEANEVAPELSMRIEPASIVEDIKMYGEEHMIPEIEECEE